MDIFKIVDDKLCTTLLKAKTKEECLDKLAVLMSENCDKLEYADVLHALQEREEQGTTGFTDGIAIPHARLKNIDRFFLGIALSPKGIDFASMDGKKSHLFFILVGPAEETAEHLKLLAQISRVVKDGRAVKEMRGAMTRLSLKEIFLRHVRGFDVDGTGRQNRDKLLIFILNEVKYLNDILQLYLERGIRGAAVLESKGMRNVLSSVPLFGDFLNFLGERSDESSTILTVVAEPEIQPLVSSIEEIMGDLATHSGAMVLAVDLFYSKGSLEV